MDDRYQHQTRFVKAYRWLRWKPLFAVVTIVRLLRWVMAGCRPLVYPPHEDFPEHCISRWGTIGHIIMTQKSRAEMKMRHYHTMNEVLAELRTNPRGHAAESEE